jgi:hypothetical protein
MRSIGDATSSKQARVAPSPGASASKSPAINSKLNSDPKNFSATGNLAVSLKDLREIPVQHIEIFKEMLDAQKKRTEQAVSPKIFGMQAKELLTTSQFNKHPKYAKLLLSLKKEIHFLFWPRMYASFLKQVSLSFYANLLHDSFAKSYLADKDLPIQFIADVETIISSAIQEGIDNIQLSEPGSNHGARLKKQTLDFLPHTQIISEGGRVFNLLNTLNDTDFAKIKARYPQFCIDKKAKWQGGFGVGRLIEEVSTGNIFFVKKVPFSKESEHELQQFERIEHLPKYFTPCLDTVLIKNGAKHTRYFITEFHPNENLGVCFNRITQELAEIEAFEIKKIALAQSLAQFSRLVLYHLLSAVNLLHQSGIAHQDLKPENIIIVDGQLKIIDYGVMHDVNFSKSGSGTRFFYSPETGSPHYTAGKQDVFAIGVIGLLLQSLNGNFAELRNLSKDEIQKTMQANNHESNFWIDTLNCHSHLQREMEYKVIVNIFAEQFVGFENTEHLVGDCLHDVIAKLMEENPDKRISLQAALALPCFAGIDPEQLIAMPEPTTVFNLNYKQYWGNLLLSVLAHGSMGKADTF